MERITGSVVVTGAATGIGRALALEAARRGGTLIAIDVDDCGDTVAMIATSGGRATKARADVRDVQSMAATADATCGPDGTVDVLCANAGIGAGGTVDSVTADGVRAILEVNVIGVLNTVQAFLPALRRARAAGRAAGIVITGSEHSLGVPPHVPPMLAYTTSKHALLGLAGCLRRDLAADGIAVTLLCPSYVRTERLQSYAAADPRVEEVLATYGQDVADIAMRAFDGLGRGAFVVPTSPWSVEFVTAMHQDILRAMDAVGP